MITKEELQANVITTRNSLITDRLDMSFGEILAMYEREELIIDPDFQRLFRWSLHQQTRFIESLLLGIPIPPIFVAENEEGKWEIVDGLQRISTVLSFFGQLRTIEEKNNWKMEKGDLVPSLENYTYENLPLKLKLNFKRAVCRVEIIKWNSAIDMRYELFNRLNTGGSPLREQEIRNCIFRGVSREFNDTLKELANDESFIDLIKPTEKQVSELYLEELVLRFISLVDNWENINKMLSVFMTNYMRDAVHNKNYDYEHYKNLFRRSIAFIPSSSVFRARNGAFSTSLYDCILVGIGLKIDSFEGKSQHEIAEKIELIKTDQDIRSLMGPAAAYKTKVIKRIQRSLEILGD